MSVKVAPPFKLALRIPEDGVLDPDEINLEKLRDVVLGKDASFARSAAMALLLRSDSPNKDYDFATVLEDETVPARVRYLAAVTLAKVDTRAAQDILIKNLSIRDERVRAGVLIGLGRIGDRSALEAIERLDDKSKPAWFAATLIAHRLGVEGHELQVPDEKHLLDLPASTARAVDWQRADAGDVRLCLRSLANDPFGIAYAEEPAYHVRCGRRQLMVLFNRELTAQDIVKRSIERKALAGVVALRNESNGLYSVSLLILTSPNLKNEEILLMLCQTNGDIGYAGRALVKGSSAEFSLRAVPRAGAFPIRFEGAFQDGTFKIKTALSAVFVFSRHQPNKGISSEKPKAE